MRKPNCCASLQEREIRRVGENVARPVDVRVIAATNVRLVDAVGSGQFRGDLLFRLGVIRIRLPGLGRSSGRHPDACAGFLENDARPGDHKGDAWARCSQRAVSALVAW